MISYRITELVAEHEARKKELTEYIKELQRQLNESPEAMTIRFLAADLRANELQAKLDAVERVIADLATQSTNSHAVKLLRKALQEQKDEQ